MTECRYPTKRRFDTRALAREGAANIRAVVEARGEVFNTLYPYRCPSGPHWHLSSARQGFADCGQCGTRRPAWFDSVRREWVIYAHDRCQTQAVSR
ncbi:hypothetical protein PBI_THONKO_51 [Mycobacterium phage Thonko]|uniref:Uncharacterized protein n=1 Tax=Mycobacterium phage Thonko TaxID=2282910 RepID=A0A346FC98_9CAUD|nr:hypothetical protein I5G57_gp051 [Mycobacterium phage Thonko]AXN53323.1 hypothetical protein PBI_THONKO_51 [Mycobacterium phage Thonko]